MSDNKVEYEMNLKDLFTQQIAKAHASTSHFEKGLEQVTEKLGGIRGMIIEAFGVYKTIEYAKESVQEFTKEAQNMAQIQNILTNTHGASGQTMESLKELAEAQENLTLYTESQSMAAEKQLLSFRNVRGEIFDKALPALEDYASFMGVDVKEAADTMGRALNNPIMASRMLRQMHIALTPVMEATIKKMVTTGHMAEAQAIILDQVNKSFGGAAKAAANANPYLKLAQAMEKIKLMVGELIVKGLNKFYPALKSIMDMIKNSLSWLKEHAELLKAVAFGVGLAAASFVVWKLVTWDLVAALEMLWANPIGLIVAGIIALGAALYETYQHCETFRTAVDLVVDSVKYLFGMDISGSNLEKSFGGLKTFLDGVKTSFEYAIRAEGALIEMTKALAHGEAISLAEAMGRVEMVLSGHAADSQQDKANKKRLAELAALKGKTGTFEGGANSIAPKGMESFDAGTDKVTGTKATTINITIGSLIEKFTISTTNLEESANKIKEAVAKALLEAVDDSQVVAGT